MKKINNIFPFLVLVAVMVLGVLVVPTFAQEPAKTEVTMDQVNKVARQLNCPTCQSLNLEDCRTQTCSQWRDQIKDLLAQGYTEQEVLDWYIARFGVEVLQEPRRQGTGLWVWLLPAVGLLAGVTWLGFILKRWSAAKAVPVTAPTADESPGEPIVDDYLQQVEKDLKEL